MPSLSLWKAWTKNRNHVVPTGHNDHVIREEVCMSKKSALELYPNLFAPAPVRPQPAKASPADMRLVQFLMRQMGSRRPSAAAPTRPVAAKMPSVRPAAPSRPGAPSRPLGARAAQR
jgi:hypothetical protein